MAGLLFRVGNHFQDQLWAFFDQVELLERLVQNPSRVFARFACFDELITVLQVFNRLYEKMMADEDDRVRLTATLALANAVGS